jgi:hypothetical protein
MAEDKMRRSIVILTLLSAVAIVACSLDVPTLTGTGSVAFLDVTIFTPGGEPANNRDVRAYTTGGSSCSDNAEALTPSYKTGTEGHVLAPLYFGPTGTHTACVWLLVFGGVSFRDTIVTGFDVTFRSPDATVMDTLRAEILLNSR